MFTSTARYLDKSCGDRDARTHIDALLAANDAAGHDWLMTGAAANVNLEDRAVFRLPAGTRIGAYEVLEEIAVGGMGAVYRVKRADGQYEQEAALKILRAELGGELAALRFCNERQLLARFDHPHIAKILDGGVTGEGIPYLVMELIDGRPITKYCDEQRLEIEQRIRLVQQVCAAVQVAHQHLVVHRDIKPSNILVTQEGTPKLLDFGIAKLLDAGPPIRKPMTEMGMQLLTPDYASPEQFLGEPITTATDVYAIGLLLYELLCGRRAARVRRHTPQEIATAFERDPVRPSDAIVGDDATDIAGARSESRDKLRRRLRGDLDNIVMKAIAVSPSQRYASVRQLSDDLQRHLDALPVLARGDGAAYRIGKFVRRHRVEVLAASLVVCSLIGGIVATSYQAHKEQLQRERAERHFNSVRKLADAFIFRVHDSIAKLPGSTEARSILVSTGLEYLNTLAAEADNDRLLKFDLANAFAQLASIQGQAYSAHTGDQQSALEMYRKSSALLEEVLAQDGSNIEARHRLADNLVQQSLLLMQQGDAAEATRLSELGMEMHAALASRTGEARFRQSLADAQIAHAMNLSFSGNEEAASKQAQLAIEILEELVDQAPSDASLKRRLTRAYANGTGLNMGTTRNDAAIERALSMYLKAFAIDEELIGDTKLASADDVRSLASDHINIGVMLNLKGDYRAAIDHFRAATDHLRNLGADAKNAQVEVDLGLLAAHHARALRELGHLGESERVASDGIAMLEQVALRNDNLVVQFSIASNREVLGGVHERRAQNSNSTSAARNREWRLALADYQDAMPRFERVLAAVTLDFSDLVPIDNTRAGLIRSTAALQGKAQ